MGNNFIKWINFTGGSKKVPDIEWKEFKSERVVGTLMKAIFAINHKYVNEKIHFCIRMDLDSFTVVKRKDGEVCSILSHSFKPSKCVAMKKVLKYIYDETENK